METLVANWEWPQWTAAGLYLFALTSDAILHGKPKTGLHSFPVRIMSVAIGALILSFGGFFS